MCESAANFKGYLPAPARAGRHRRARGRWGLAVALALGSPAAASADPDLRIDALGVRDGIVCASIRLVDAFDEDTRNSIERGLPITVRFTTELWRDRKRWFDKQLDARVETFRVRYSPGERRFAVTSTGRFRHTETFAALDDVIQHFAVRTVEAHPRWNLEDRHSYYVTVEVAIQPLTLEEFRELDGWISGRIRGDGRDRVSADGSGNGSDGAQGGPEGGRGDVPDRTDPEDAADGRGDGSSGGGESEGGGFSGAFFDFFVDLAGFGDRILRKRSPNFRPPELRELPRLP